MSFIRSRLQQILGFLTFDAKKIMKTKNILQFSQDESNSTLSLLSADEESANRISISQFGKASINLSLNLLLESFPNIISLCFMGKYSTVDVLSTFGIVLVFGISLGYGIFEGLASGLESFLTSIQQGLPIVIYQRTLVISTFLMVPITILLWLIQAFVFPIILSETSTIAGYMLMASCVSIYFNGLYVVSRSYKNSQHSFNNQIKSTLTATGIHILACLFFFQYCEFTIYGAVLAKIVTDIFNLNLFLRLIKISNQIKLEVFQSIRSSQLLSLTKRLFSKGMVLYLQIMAYQAFTIQVISLAFTEISTHIIASSIHNIGYVIYIGIGVAAHLNISKYLLNNKKTSIKYMKCGAAFLISAAILFYIFLIFVPWRGVFTNNSEVVEHLLYLTPFIVIYMIVDCVQVFVSAVSRSLGEHPAAFRKYLICVLLIGQPLCVLLKGCMPQQGVVNVWVGMVVSVLIYNIWQGVFLLNIDVRHAARKMEEEMEQEQSSRDNFIEIYYPEYVRAHSIKSCDRPSIQMPRLVSRTYSL